MSKEDAFRCIHCGEVVGKKIHKCSVDYAGCAMKMVRKMKIKRQIHERIEIECSLEWIKDAYRYCEENGYKIVRGGVEDETYILVAEKEFDARTNGILKGFLKLIL